jgi:hypothetical protein
MGRPQPGTPMQPRGACRCGVRVCHRLTVFPSRSSLCFHYGTVASRPRQRICRAIVFRHPGWLVDPLVHRMRWGWCSASPRAPAHSAECPMWTRAEARAVRDSLTQVGPEHRAERSLRAVFGEPADFHPEAVVALRVPTQGAQGAAGNAHRMIILIRREPRLATAFARTSAIDTGWILRIRYRSRICCRRRCGPPVRTRVAGQQGGLERGRRRSVGVGVHSGRIVEASCGGGALLGFAEGHVPRRRPLYKGHTGSIVSS